MERINARFALGVFVVWPVFKGQAARCQTAVSVERFDIELTTVCEIGNRRSRELAGRVPERGSQTFLENRVVEG